MQLKLGDFRSSLSNFEKVLEVQPENSDALKVSGLGKGFSTDSKLFDLIEYLYIVYKVEF